MAYLARIERMDGQPATQAVSAQPAAEVADFSSFEWSIIRFARGDRLSTLREPGPLRRFANWLIGLAGNRRLANERLEALRRIAVLSWRFGFSVPGEEVANFLSAGFTPGQYELLVTSVRAAAGANVQNIFGEARA
jgi:hypothetical protein